MGAGIVSDSAWHALTDDERRSIRRGASLARSKRREAALREAGTTRPNVIIDLSFDSLMSDRQIVSLAQQLSFCHATTKRSRALSQPALTHCLSSFGGRVEERLLHIHGASAWPVARHRGSYLDVADSYPGGIERLIYLSADGEETVSSFDPERIYVIGGLVDRNCHRGLTFRRAQAAGVRTARFPLDEAVQVKRESKGRALAVNHCFEMLALRAHGRKWDDVILEVMPQRRGATRRAVRR